MKIQDILSETRTISFEFFPPREASGKPAVLGKIESLKSYSPSFISVTYGAGGSTRQFTEELTIKSKTDYDMEVMAHLTCVGHTVKELDEVLERLESSSIESKHQDLWFTILSRTGSEYYRYNVHDSLDVF